MARWIRFAAVVFVLAALSACTDRSGRRVSMGGWWQDRFGKKAESPPPDDGEAVGDAEGEPRSRRVADRAEPDAKRGATRGGEVVRPTGLFVNGEIVKTNDILEPIAPSLAQLMKELPRATYTVRALDLVRRQIIEEVAQRLIYRRAQESITDELKPQLDKAVDKMEKERINHDFGGRETVYEKYLTRHDKTRAQVRERLRRMLIIDSYLREKLLPLAPPARRSELLEYYEKHRGEFTIAERREMLLIDIPWRTMLKGRSYYVPRSEQLDAAHEAALARANQALAAIRGGRKFEDVAREYSDGLHKESGGGWGMITAASEPGAAALQGRWALPAKRLFELAADETSEILDDTEHQACFIVRCGAILPGKIVSFKEAQPQIAQRIRQQRFAKLRTEFLQAELDKSTIGSLDEFIRQVMEAAPQQARLVDNDQELPAP